jgi:hypothetical protein
MEFNSVLFHGIGRSTETTHVQLNPTAAKGLKKKN